MKRLLKVTEHYRLDTQHEVDEFIEEAKTNSIGGGYTLAKYGSEVKEKKQKGEIIDNGFLVTLVKDYGPFFND